MQCNDCGSEIYLYSKLISEISKLQCWEKQQNDSSFLVDDTNAGKEAIGPEESIEREMRILDSVDQQ